MSQLTLGIPDLLPLRAQVQAVLLHPEVQDNELRSDAACDLLLALGDAEEVTDVLRAFSSLRQACGSTCYLPLFRLRRWMEAAAEMRVGPGEWSRCDLRDADFDRIVRRAQRQCWELDLAIESPDEVEVEFRWLPLEVAATL